MCLIDRMIFESLVSFLIVCGHVAETSHQPKNCSSIFLTPKPPENIPQQLQVRNPDGLRLTLGRSCLLTKPVMWILSIQCPIQLLTDGHLLKVSTSMTDLMAWARVRSEVGAQPGWSLLWLWVELSLCFSRVSGLVGLALTFFHFHLPKGAISEQSENCSLLLPWPFRCSHEQLLNQAAGTACWELCTPRHSWNVPESAVPLDLWHSGTPGSAVVTNKDRDWQMRMSGFAWQALSFFC